MEGDPRVDPPRCAMPTDETPPPSPYFLLVAVILEGSLAVAAVAIGWLVGFDPAATCRWTAEALAGGALAAAPLLVLLWGCVKLPWRPLRRIVEVIDQTLAPLLRDGRLIELAAVSAVAGVGEELLFRGLVQGGLAAWIGPPYGTGFGLFVGALVFGLVHPITTAYAMLAGLIGFYLGILWLATGNLVVPIATHAVYDFCALVYLLRLRQPDPAKPEAIDEAEVDDQQQE